GYIMAGVNSLAAMPHGVFSSGTSFGYDPATKMLYKIHPEVGSEALVPRFGGPELNFELVPLLDEPQWKKVWLQYCQYLAAPAAEQVRAIGGAVNTGRTSDYARMPAYAGFILKDPALGKQAWDQFLHGGQSGGNPLVNMGTDPFSWQRVDGPQVPAAIDEISNISTNSTSQWCLNAIELLELAKDEIPAK
ncbi:MAG: hypothetical protein ABSH22_17985, partial [Tepidisphaeraceae bacterium]